MIAGDNAILQRSVQAKQKTEKAQIIEEAQIEILGNIVGNEERKTGKITDTDAKEILNKYFNGVPEDLTQLETNMTTKNKGYLVKLKEVLGNTTVVGSEPGEEQITLETLKGFIDNNDVCWDREARTYTQKLKCLGSYDWNTGWSSASAYRCSIDDNIYIVGTREGQDEEEMEQVYWDGTTTLDGDGKPLTLVTPFGTFQRGLSSNNGEFGIQERMDYDLNETYYDLYVVPEFNNVCLLNYWSDGKVKSVQWLD